MPKGEKVGIFCLQGNWSFDLRDRSTVALGLEMLYRGNSIPYIHRTVATREELVFYLKKWTNVRYQKYPILYFAFHGEPGMLRTSERGNRAFIALDEIAEVLKGRCEHQVIYFGSCKSLDIPISQIKEFLKKTKALAVCGFRNYIDWLNSTAFDLMVFEVMQEYDFDLRGFRYIEGKIKRRARSLHKNLRFRMVLRDPV